MLTAFTDEAERRDKTVVFRTWSVGVGAVGDMHTDPESYHEVLDGIDCPRLVVSTKYTLGDFYSQLPLNDTLETGEQRRIVEFQSRREFESFGAIPNDLGDLYQQALQHVPRRESERRGGLDLDPGRWSVACRADDTRADQRLLAALRPQHGADRAAGPRPRHRPRGDHERLGAPVVLDRSTDGAAITTAMALSRDAVTHGLYIGQYADKRVFAIGLEPPPMMWIFEWDILTGDSAVLDVIYSVVRKDGRRRGRDRRG